MRTHNEYLVLLVACTFALNSCGLCGMSDQPNSSLQAGGTFSDTVKKPEKTKEDNKAKDKKPIIDPKYTAEVEEYALTPTYDPNAFLATRVLPRPPLPADYVKPVYPDAGYVNNPEGR